MRGLSFLRSFVHPRPPDDELRELTKPLPPQNCHQSLPCGAWERRRLSHYDVVMLKDYSDDRVKAEIGSSFIPHLDHGPAQAWWWVHERQTKYHLVYSLDTRKLRARGYVMWDHVRLVEWGCFQSEWQPPSRVDYLPDLKLRENAMLAKQIEKKNWSSPDLAEVREPARPFWG